MPPFEKGHPQYGHTRKGSKHQKTLAREAGRAKALAEEAITAEVTMRQIARIATSDIGEVFDEHGQLQPLRSLPPHVRSAVASVKTLKTNVVSGDGQQEVTREVRLWDKVSALTLLAKHFGLVTERHEVSFVTPEQREMLNQAKIANRRKTEQK